MRANVSAIKRRAIKRRAIKHSGHRFQCTTNKKTIPFSIL
jgi:hypothetical protein